jgi:uncharacterized integral membrane protein
MTDYYPVISRAVAALSENTVNTRRALYDRARAAQTAQLRRLDPPLDKKDFDQQCSSLEDAINRIEQEIIDRQTPAAQKATAEPQTLSKVENDRNTPIITSPVVATSPPTKQVFSAKRRWTKIGAVIGLILAAIDLLFLNRRNVGETDLPYIIGFLSSPTILGALVGFITGAIKDFISSRSVVYRPNVEQRLAEGHEQTRKTDKLNIVSMH